MDFDVREQGDFWGETNGMDSRRKKLTYISLPDYLILIYT